MLRPQIEVAAPGDMQGRGVVALEGFNGAIGLLRKLQGAWPARGMLKWVGQRRSCDPDVAFFENGKQLAEQCVESRQLLDWVHSVSGTETKGRPLLGVKFYRGAHELAFHTDSVPTSEGERQCERTVLCQLGEGDPKTLAKLIVPGLSEPCVFGSAAGSALLLDGRLWHATGQLQGFLRARYKVAVFFGAMGRGLNRWCSRKQNVGLNGHMLN